MKRRLLHSLWLPHFALIDNVIYFKFKQQCPKGRAGYTCHGRANECGYPKSIKKSN